MGDNPFTEHEKFFPNCPRVALGPNVELNRTAGSGINTIGIQHIRTPKRGKYLSLDARIRTFSRWPRSDIQQPEVLATAGFYYCDIDDQVRCFHCNGGLRSWQQEDDPWFEHARWFPKCQFVELVKGAQYIADVQGQTVRPTLDEAMSSEPVQKALQMGLHEGRIRAVTKNYIDSTGKPYSSVEELVDAVLSIQYEEEQNDDSEDNQSSSTIVREVSRILDTIFNPREPLSIDPEPEEPVQNIEHRPRINVSESHENNNRINVPENEERAVQSPPSPAIGGASGSVIAPNVHQNVGEPNEQLTLEEENRKLKDARLCKVCMCDEVGVVFLPCGHLGKLSLPV